MRAENDNGRDSLDESLRRLGGILASPSLLLSYEHTTPLLERSWLRRMGLTKDEERAFLELLCRHGLLDQGARAVTEQVCRLRQIPPSEALQVLLRDEGWPDEDKCYGEN